MRRRGLEARLRQPTIIRLCSATASEMTRSWVGAMGPCTPLLNAHGVLVPFLEGEATVKPRGAGLFVAGSDAYDRHMGRYSRELSMPFVALAGVSQGMSGWTWVAVRVR